MKNSEEQFFECIEEQRTKNTPINRGVFFVLCVLHSVAGGLYHSRRKDGSNDDRQADSGGPRVGWCDRGSDPVAVAHGPG